MCWLSSCRDARVVGSRLLAVPSGVLTFTRCVLTSAPSWYRDETSLSRLHVSSSGTIEDDGAGMLQVGPVGTRQLGRVNSPRDNWVVSPHRDAIGLGHLAVRQLGHVAARQLDHITSP